MPRNKTRSRALLERNLAALNEIPAWGNFVVKSANLRVCFQKFLPGCRLAIGSTGNAISREFLDPFLRVPTGIVGEGETGSSLTAKTPDAASKSEVAEPPGGC